MNEQIFPTKGNLITTKKSLILAKIGYELLDRKRNILIREMMALIDRAKSIRGSIEDTYKHAYSALEKANITLGSSNILNIAESVPIEEGVEISYRSVMGVEIPQITFEEKPMNMSYGLYKTNSQVDIAYICFDKVKKMTVTLAEVENSIYRLAIAIKKTQSRANALKNIIIPKYEGTVKFITDSLEEKEREEFSRLKVIKTQKMKKSQ